MAKKSNRILIKLTCSACKSHNYTTEKNKINDPDKIALIKFCQKCRKKTEHKEAK